MSFADAIRQTLLALRAKLDAGRPADTVSNQAGESDSRVVFELNDSPYGAERMWATSLGENQYRVDNSPFYVYGVSWQDVVEAVSPEEDKHPVFQRVVKKSGHRTIRVICDQDDEVLKTLNRKGCTYEGASERYFSVNIPPSVDLGKVVSFLENAEAEWEHADPTYASLHPEESA